MTLKPKLSKELEKAGEQFDAFDENIKSLTLDRLNETPKKELEPINKFSSKDLSKSSDIYLKPFRTIGCKEKFNERFRAEYEQAKKYVQFIAYNKELIGEEIEIWTRPYPGLPAEWWKVPTGKPIWAPCYLAEQIKRKFYHRLVMQQTNTGSDGMGQYYGSIAADTTIQRLDAEPVSGRKSIFMGSDFTPPSPIEKAA
jgi:hypothetical protein